MRFTNNPFAAQMPHALIVNAHVAVAGQVKDAKARVAHVTRNAMAHRTPNSAQVLDVRREAAEVLRLEASLRAASYRVTR